jgi:hypothetical protein
VCEKEREDGLENKNSFSVTYNRINIGSVVFKKERERKKISVY